MASAAALWGVGWDETRPKGFAPPVPAGAREVARRHTHVPEKCEAVFGQEHARNRILERSQPASLGDRLWVLPTLRAASANAWPYRRAKAGGSNSATAGARRAPISDYPDWRFQGARHPLRASEGHEPKLYQPGPERPREGRNACRFHRWRHAFWRDSLVKPICCFGEAARCDRRHASPGPYRS